MSAKDADEIATSSNVPGESHSFSFHRGLFQQIWAANDMRTFVKLMVQRNIEIQLQALDLLERRQASIPETNETEEEIQVEVENSVLNENQPETIQEVKVDEDEPSSSTITKADVEDEDKFKRLNILFQKQQIDSSDVQARQEYLRQQRDKILQIKKQARARQLHEAAKAKLCRPKSAHAAQKVIDGETIEPDEASVQVRKLLAKKLREEVVGIKENQE
jgi:hypothetical protein